MSAYQKGQVRVVDGETTVRHVFRCLYGSLSGGTGSLVVGESCTWDGGASAGVITGQSVSASRAHVVRTSGSDPALGDTITGSTSGTSFTIDAFAEGTPADYASNIAVGEVFLLGDNPTIYQVSGSITATTFAISPAWSGEAPRESDYKVVRDYTASRGYAKPQLGEIDPTTTIARALDQIDSDVAKLGFSQVAFTSASNASTADFTAARLLAHVATEDTLITFVEPAGPSVLGLLLTQDSTVRAITWDARVEWITGNAPDLAVADEVYVLLFLWDGDTFHGIELTDTVPRGLPAFTSSSNAATADWRTSPMLSHAATEDTTLTFVAPNGPAELSLLFTQDDPARTITWPGSVTWLSGTAPALTTIDEVSLIRFLFDGTTYYGWEAV